MPIARRLAAAATIAPLLVAGAAGAASAVYPPNPSNGSAQSATTIPAGGSVNFTFGDPAGTRYMSNSTVTVNCTGPTNAPAVGTTTVADGSGVANVTLTFTTPGTWTCSATGVAPDGVPLTIAAKPVLVTASGQPDAKGITPISGDATAAGDATATSATSGALAQTGGNNTLLIAAVGGGLLLAGVGIVYGVTRTREKLG